MPGGGWECTSGIVIAGSSSSIEWRLRRIIVCVWFVFVSSSLVRLKLESRGVGKKIQKMIGYR